MSRTLSAATDALSLDNVSVDDGGTSAATAAEALVNLNAIPASALDQPGGIAGLDSNKKIKLDVIPNGVSTGISVMGPASLEISQTGTYIISNYDVFTNYEILAISGMASRSGETITYEAPSKVEPGGFIINGRTVTIAITSPVINKPAITSPIDAATNIASSLMLVSNVFGVTGGTDIHEASDWQLSTDIGFSNIVSQLINDVSNKSSWIVTGLLINTVYYARVRYRGATYGYGEWSDATSFTTKSLFIPTTEEALVVPSDPEANARFGSAVALTANGSRLAISSPYKDEGGVSTAGAVYVFTRSGTSWVFEAKLVADDATSGGDWLGGKVAITADGSRIIAGASGHNHSALSDPGAVYVFVRNNTTWSLETKLIADAPSADAFYGHSVDITADGTRAVIGAINYDKTGTTNSGGVYVYSRSSSTWTLEAKLEATDAGDGDYFGHAVAINSDGGRVVVGAIYNDAGGITDSGAAYVFARSGTTWTQEAKLLASDSTVNDNFGFSVAISADGTKIAIGSPTDDPIATTNAGSVYVFAAIGIAWSQEAKLIAGDYSIEAWFGSNVAINDAGNIIAVGALRMELPETYTGKVYIYNSTGSSWAESASLISADRTSDDYYARSIALVADGSILAVGANQRTVSSITQAGSVYTFN